MTIRELRNKILYDIENQDQEIDVDDICRIIKLYDKVKEIERAVISWEKDNKVSEDFMLFWLGELHKSKEELKNYIGGK